MPSRSADALSGLPSRSALRAQLRKVRDREDRRVRPCALLSIGFGVVDAPVGRVAMDLVREALAHRLEAAVRQGDLLARLGDDHFGLVSWGAGTAEEAVQLALRLLESTRPTVRSDGQAWSPLVRIGITLAPRDGVDPDLLIANAELAMHRAGAEAGTAWRLFSQDMDEAVRDRVALQHDLRHALTRRQFTLEYQPQQRLADGEIVGCEALLRWVHPVRGAVPSAEFIPLAEASGLIGTIGRWVLEQACRQASRWPATCTVSVNVSAAQFEDGKLLDTVRAALAASGLPASRLELEVTESMLMHDHAAANVALRSLRELGVRIALDDFGTGYSSLAYLRQMPLDRLKIDRSFVTALQEDAGAAAIVKAIIDLARALGLHTIAEGVETAAQSALLRAIGCDEVQGFLVAAPMGEKPLQDFLAAWPGRASTPGR